jgi:hypothetical protein
MRAHRLLHSARFTLALTIALTVGCSAPNTGGPVAARVAISVAELGPHESISDPVDIVLRFHNNSKEDLVLPLHDLAPEENLFLRLSRRDPIQFVQSALAGRRDVLVPFSDTRAATPVRIPPGENHDYPLPRSSMLRWIFVARDVDHDSDLTGKFYVRIAVKLPVVAPADEAMTTKPSAFTAVSPPVEVVFSRSAR